MKKFGQLVFFGNERLATAVTTKAPILRALIYQGYEIGAVVASHSPSVSRSQRRLEIVEVAHTYHIPVLLPDKPAEVIDKLKNYQAEAAVLVAYGRIIPQAIIDIFPKGIINIHPSLLPKYRGPTPIETAILDGAKKTGVSLMQLTAKMDAGPVYAQQEMVLTQSETKQQLADKLESIGKQLLIKNLPKILSGWLKAEPQDETKASYTKLIKKGYGKISWDEPAEIIDRKVIAYSGWPKTQAKINGHDVIITKVRIAKSNQDGQLVMPAKPGWIEVLELLTPNGRLISGSDFLKGYKPKN